MKAILDNKSIVKQKSNDLLASDLNEEIIFMNLESGDYIGLNAVGSTIWKLIESPRSVEEIVQNLLTNYEVEENLCQEKALQFLNHMHQEDMIEIL